MERKNLYILLGILLAVLAAALAVGFVVGKAGSRHLGRLTGVGAETEAPAAENAEAGRAGRPPGPNAAPIDQAKAVKELARQRGAALDDALER